MTRITEDRKAFMDFIEGRALQADNDALGGYMLGESVFPEVIQAVGDACPMRRISRILPPLGEGVDEINIPSVEALLTDATWTTELLTGSDDSSIPFGGRLLKPKPIAKRLRVSKKLLRLGGQFAEQTVIDLLGLSLGIPADSAYIQGTTGEPLGLLNTAGLPILETANTSQLDVSTVRKWATSLPARFQRVKPTILCHPDFLTALTQWVDGDGAYIFPNVDIGFFLNADVALSDQFPSPGTDPASMTSGAWCAVIGNFMAGYWIIDNGELVITRLEELYAAYNEVGFIPRFETDGMAVIPTAFYGLKIKAS